MAYIVKELGWNEQSIRSFLEQLPSNEEDLEMEENQYWILQFIQDKALESMDQLSSIFTQDAIEEIRDYFDPTTDFDKETPLYWIEEWMDYKIGD